MSDDQDNYTLRHILSAFPLPISLAIVATLLNALLANYFLTLNLLLYCEHYRRM